MKNEDKNQLNRKDFIKGIGAAGLGAAAAGIIGCQPKEGNTEGNNSSDKDGPANVPKRTLGKTGVKVPSLNHGIMYNLVENQAVLYKGLQWGINYWDTAHSYSGGYSELGIGKFLKKNPDKRSSLFIASKASRANTPDEIEKRLQLSLKRMNTSYIDLYYGVHGMNDPADLTDELRKWAESAKKRKLIRHFGFTTHKNMAPCLMKAAKMDWIDAVMTSYNFRLMQDSAMQDAIAALDEANVGIVAMKLMALPVQSEGDQKLVREFTKRGFTEGQAKIKAVLNDERVASVCVTMPSTSLIATNASAVLDRKLSSAEMEFLRQYAMSPECSGYCAGCSEFCESALPQMPYVSDIMRYLMYYNNYGEEAKARELFAEEVPAHIRSHLLQFDYSVAEAKCPQKLVISELMKEAAAKLA